MRHALMNEKLLLERLVLDITVMQIGGDEKIAISLPPDEETREVKEMRMMKNTARHTDGARGFGSLRNVGKKLWSETVDFRNSHL